MEKKFKYPVIEWSDANYPEFHRWMPVEKFKEFIKRLKELLPEFMDYEIAEDVMKEVNKLTRNNSNRKK